VSILTNTSRVSVSKKTNLGKQFAFAPGTSDVSLVGLEITSLVANGVDLNVRGTYKLTDFHTKINSEVIGAFDIRVVKGDVVLIFSDKQIDLLASDRLRVAKPPLNREAGPTSVVSRPASTPAATPGLLGRLFGRTK
jgi:hypothetical protein